ncbi:11163_t:CDS:2, partial [Paraglomus occultum]
ISEKEGGSKMAGNNAGKEKLLYHEQLKTNVLADKNIAIHDPKCEIIGTSEKKLSKIVRKILRKENEEDIIEEEINFQVDEETNSQLDDEQTNLNWLLELENNACSLTWQPSHQEELGMMESTVKSLQDILGFRFQCSVTMKLILELHCDLHKADDLIDL